MVPSTPSEDQLILSLSRTRRDLRWSLAILVAGLATLAVFLLAEFLHLGSSPVDPQGLYLGIAGEVGYGMAGVGALFAVINWSLLRQHQRRKLGSPDVA